MDEQQATDGDAASAAIVELTGAGATAAPTAAITAGAIPTAAITTAMADTVATATAATRTATNTAADMETDTTSATVLDAATATSTATATGTLVATGTSATTAASIATATGPTRRPTLHGEFARVVRTRPDWLYGLLCSWGFGYGFLAYIVFFTHPDLKHDPMPTAVLVVLSAIADGSLTNQLAAEPEWASGLLRAGEDPARILRVRNLMLVLCELFFVCTVVAIIARLGHSEAWIPRALPQLAVLPLAPIAIGNLTSVLIPTPFMRLSSRFQAPGTWVRWAIYVAIPFVLSSLSLALYWLPSRVESHYEPRVLERVGSLKHLTVTISSATHVYVAVWLVLSPLWQLGIWLISLRLADGLARMRRHGLARLMDRHTELAGSLPPLSLYQATRQLPVRCREIPTDLRAEVKLIGSELLEASTTFSRL